MGLLSLMHFVVILILLYELLSTYLLDLKKLLLLNDGVKSSSILGLNVYGVISLFFMFILFLLTFKISLLYVNDLFDLINLPSVDLFSYFGDGYK
jgi:hypothetical protein